MGNLRKIKRKMKLDKDLRKTLVRSAKDEILIDVDGDGLPDVGLLDSTGDGNIDTITVDLTGDGEFDLYFHDSDGNGIPDMILLDEDGDGMVDFVAAGTAVEEAVVQAATDIFLQMAAEEYVAEVLEAALDKMQANVDEARKLQAETKAEG